MPPGSVTDSPTEIKVDWLEEVPFLLGAAPRSDAALVQLIIATTNVSVSM